MAELHLDPARFEQAREAAVRAFTPKGWKLSDPQRVLLNVQMHAAVAAALDVFLKPVVEMAIDWVDDQSGEIDPTKLMCAEDLVQLLLPGGPSSLAGGQGRVQRGA